MTSHVFRVAEARRINHPIHREIEKHTFLVNVNDLPFGLSKDPNARDFGGSDIRKRVYREVKETLMNENSLEGVFDLLNKGIVIIASEVSRKNDHEYHVRIETGQGIVDGGHTYDIITQTRSNQELPSEQFVEVRVLTGIKHGWISDISMGLNSGIQVQKHSLDYLDGKYGWLQDVMTENGFRDLVAWRESDKGVIDVRDLICILEALNIFDFPNDSGSHPVAAYEKWRTPTEKFSSDYDESYAKGLPKNSKYRKLKPLLIGGLKLMDFIRCDFRTLYNEAIEGGRGAGLSIVEEAKGTAKPYLFPFSGSKPSRHRLTKGATYPIFAAFRNAVELDEVSGDARWKNGFEGVLTLWKESAPEIMRATRNAIRDYGHKPDLLGKHRGHWGNMHQTVELYMLRQQIQSRGKLSK